MTTKRMWGSAVVIAALLFGTACYLTAGRGGKAVAASPPTDVEVASVVQQDVPVYREWVGTLDGYVNAAIRAQVTGYLLTQNYAEGSFVKKGQLLFEIDPRPLQAIANRAQAQYQQSVAQLASAEANQRKAQFDENRYIPLAKEHAVTQQDLDNAVQNNIAAKAQVNLATAQVDAAKAALEEATVNLGFTKLYSPIDGVAGNAQIQIGNLVSPASPAVTTVSTLDPVKVTFAISEQEYLRLRRERKPGDPVPPLELILADGTVYAHPGVFSFTGRQVNQGTGAIDVTGQFPNPGNVLRPGQYAKVRVAVETLHNALLVPQQAVSELQGSYQVATVDENGAVAIQPITVGEQIGSSWVVQSGLKAGQQVIVEGIQKVGSGMHVNPKKSSQVAQATK